MHGVGSGDTGQGDLVGVLLARNRTFAQATFSPRFFYAWAFECDLAGGSATELETGAKPPGARLIVQVRCWAFRLASSWSLKKSARTSIYLLEPGVSPASCTRVLAGFFRQQELAALHERTCAWPKACEWVGDGLAKASQKLNDSSRDTNDPQGQLAQLLHQVFARL